MFLLKKLIQWNKYYQFANKLKNIKLLASNCIYNTDKSKGFNFNV